MFVNGGRRPAGQLVSPTFERDSFYKTCEASLPDETMQQELKYHNELLSRRSSLVTDY